MNLLTKTNRKLFGYLLSFMMVLSLCANIGPVKEVKAAGFLDPIINNEEIILYDSGCLKSITITIQADKYYATAYGRIGIHTAKSSYSWTNRFIGSGCSSWPADSQFEGDPTFLTFANGDEFLWSDGTPHTVTVGFDDGDVDLSETQTYYIHLWTRSSSYGIYPDALIGTLGTQDGVLTDSNGNILVDSNADNSDSGSNETPAHTHNDITYTAINQENYYLLGQSGNYYLEEDIVISNTIQIGTGNEVNLCLNGMKYLLRLISSILPEHYFTLKMLP